MAPENEAEKEPTLDDRITAMLRSYEEDRWRLIRDVDYKENRAKMQAWLDAFNKSVELYAEGTKPYGEVREEGYEPTAACDLEGCTCKRDVPLKGPGPVYPQPSFKEELQRLLNQYSQESPSNTPDFVLVDYLQDCLNAYNKAISRREQWHG